MRQIQLLLTFLLAALSCLCAAEPLPGWQPQRRVAEPTRLDWEFAAGAAARLSNHYQSRRQHYQLYVPPEYVNTRRWPLVLFLSSGDVPQAWRLWQERCQKSKWFYAAPYAAGDNLPFTDRIRLALDVLDDVRRHYQIDPDRTYLMGQGTGVAVASRVATALPDHFGGIIALGSGVDLPQLPYLRQRLRDRLSVALISDVDGPDRQRQQQYLVPLFKGLQIRHQHWLLDQATLEGVQDWFEASVGQRQADRSRSLAGDEETPTRRLLSERGLQRARGLLQQPEGLYSAAILLEWVVHRCGATEAADRASALIEELRADPDRCDVLDRRSEAEARNWSRAQAIAFTQFGDLRAARRAWDRVARLSAEPDLPFVEEKIRLLDLKLASTPYLGVVLAGDSTTVKQVQPASPAFRADVRDGDVLLRLGAVPLRWAADLHRQMQLLRPGDAVQMTVRRGGIEVVLSLRVGSADLAD